MGFGACSGNLKEIKKIGFPWLCLNDGPTALRGADLVTVFPGGITTGATWDRELMYIRSRAMGVEARIKGANVLLSPVAGALGRAPDAVHAGLASGVIQGAGKSSPGLESRPG